MIAREYRKVGSFSEIGRGSSPRPIIDQAYFVNGSIPWIKIADATASFKYIYKTKEYVNEYGASFSRKLAPGSLILAASGTLGFPVFLGIEGCIHDGWLYFKTIDKNINKQYLYYCLITFIKSFNSVSYGAAIQNINTDILRNTEIPLPPLPVQCKIAAVLSAFDDLIEKNNRSIAILEKMAEELYREWFVRLRFPGHEKVKIVKGVPAGWEVKRITEIVDFLSGYSFKSETYLPVGKHGIVTIKNVQDGFFISESSDFIDVTPSNMKKHCMLKDGDMLMSLTGNVGRVCHVIGKDLVLNQRVAKLQPKIKQASQFIYYTFKNRSMLQLIENLSLGSTAQMNLSPIQLGKQKLLTPKDELLSFYEQKTLPLHKKVMALLQQNALLKQIRDRLLSRLMSGKIELEKMDIRFPASMQEEVENA